MKFNVKRHTKELERWRSMYNPLRGLTMQRIVSLLEAGERGEYRDLQWFYRSFEKRDATVRALKRLRLAAIGNMEWTIKTTPEDLLPKGTTLKQAEAQQEALRTAYDRISNFEDALKFLATAEFRGYAHLGKVYDNDRADGNITELAIWEQWFWLRDGIYGPWIWNYDMSRLSPLGGETIDARHWIIREVEDPIDEVAAIAYLRKNLSQKDWDGFIEVFGIPSIFAILPDGVGDDEKMKQYLELAESVVSDGRGALPGGSDIKTVGGDVRGSEPFSGHIKYQDEQIVLAGTSGKLTMLNGPTGLGSGQSDVHKGVFDDLAEAEARDIALLMRRAIDEPLLAKQFPGQPVLAYFSYGSADSDETDAVIEHNAKLGPTGYRISKGDIEERTGYEIEDTGAAPTKNQEPTATNRAANKGAANKGAEGAEPHGLYAPPANPEALLKQSRLILAEAVQKDLKPVAERLQAILADTPDDKLEAALNHFMTAELPELAKQLLADPAAAAAMNGTITASIINGLTDKDKQP